MLIDDMLFEQEWFGNLPLRLRYLYIYLLTKCTKVGVFEVNLRKFTYDMNDNQPVTRDDIFMSFGDRVKPLGESKGIFVDYVGFNWYRDKPLDPIKNPLHRGLLQELGKYGLDFSKLNKMAHKKVQWIGGENGDDNYSDNANGTSAQRLTETETNERHARFIPPSVEEVKAYCIERNNGIDAEAFVSFYESKGWLIGKSKMKSWKAAIITWEKARKSNGNNSQCIKQSDNAIHTTATTGKYLF